MVSYAGHHAEIYDILYAEKPYAREARVIHDKLLKYGDGGIRNLLELACGTGRHAFELEKLGYRILATDYSEDLLAVAKRNAAARGSTVEFRLQDMRDLDLKEPRFDAAYCLFDAIGYLQTNKGLLQVLEGVRNNLRGNGLFIFEFWHAAAMLCSYEPRRERHWKTELGEIRRVAITQLDVVHQLAEVTYEFDEQQGNQTTHFAETQTNRYFLVQEMALFLEKSGFEILEWSPAYEQSESITIDTWHILAVARRR